MHHNRPWTKDERMLLLGTMLVSMLIWILPVTGCVTHPPVVHEIDADRQVVTVHKGIPFSPPVDGKFVPEARFDEMSDVYIRASTSK